MERLKERVSIAENARSTFELALREDLGVREHRDVAILRFTYTMEATLKAIQLYFDAVGGLELAGPKSLVRASFQGGLLEEAQAERALKMVDDRNLVVHTYNERLAIELSKRLHGHHAILAVWLDRLRERL